MIEDENTGVKLRTHVHHSLSRMLRTFVGPLDIWNIWSIPPPLVDKLSSRTQDPFGISARMSSYMRVSVHDLTSVYTGVLFDIFN